MTEIVNRLTAFRSGHRQRLFFVLKLAQPLHGLAVSPRSGPIIVLARVLGHILYSTKRISLDCKLPTRSIVQVLALHYGGLKRAGAFRFGRAFKSLAALPSPAK